MIEILEVADPLRDKSCRHLKIERESKEILHLGREDRQGNTTGESYYDRIWDELENHSHLTHSHHNQEDSRHDSGNDKPLHSILSHNAGNNNNECTGRSTDKEV